MDSGTYFARYSRWGILIYCLNKKTGYKFASFKNLDRDRDTEFSFWNPIDHKIDPLDTMEIPTEILAVIRKEIQNNVIPNKDLMSEELQNKIHQYENSGETGTLRFASTGTSTATIGTTLINPSNPSYFTTSTNNIGMATTTPNTQLSIGGDIEVAGNIRMMDNEGNERIRITSSGFEMPGAITTQHSPPPKNPYSEQLEETRQDLFREIEQHLEQTQERVVEERVQQQSLLNDLELGTLDENYIKRMQKLAGIDINGVTVKLNGVEIIDEGEAEQPVVHSKYNWIDKIKSSYEKVKVHIRRSKVVKGIKQPI
jgi:hypothetical protein